ncbi:MAG: flagellar basal body protein [Bryobacteraceae bacterium]
MLDPIATRIEHYMDLLSQRQKLTASNIANAETPGYHTRDIDFQFEYMSQIEGQSPQTILPPGLTTRNDGNNVNLDREARMLSENAMRFSLASQMMRSQIRMVRSAIQDGKNS